MSFDALLRRVDWILIVTVLLLLAIGAQAVRSTTVNDFAGNPTFFDRRHLTYIAMGLVFAAVVTAIDPRIYRRLFWPIYGATIGLLIVVLGFSAARGSQRWITLPFFTLQPSELGKVTMIICLALIVADCVRRGIRGWSMVFRVALLLLVPFSLVFIQPDLGTSLVYIGITLTVLVVAGLAGRIVAVIGAFFVAVSTLVLVILPSIGIPLLRSYQSERITAFLDPQGGESGCLSGPAGEDRDRLGWADGTWRRHQSDSGALLAREPHRLHLRCRRREPWFRWLGDRDAVVPRGVLAGRTIGAAGA